MRDVGDTWNEYNKTIKEKQNDSRSNAIKILTKANINFESKNFGAHLIIAGKTETIDFWPGTGKYITRDTHRTERGIFNLLKKHCNPYT